MAKGSNDGSSRSRLNNLSSQHIADYHSLTNASTSTPNHPPTGTVSIHCSGTQNSFNNYGEGSQDFRDATINSASRNILVRNRTDTCSGTIASFNNRGSGSQDFQAAQINSGCNSAVTAAQSSNHLSARFARILNIGNSGRKFREQDRVSVSGTLHSFNNHGNGSQSFNAANINSAANSIDPLKKAPVEVSPWANHPQYITSSFASFKVVEDYLGGCEDKEPRYVDSWGKVLMFPPFLDPILGLKDARD
ncbi:hypothetical protein CR513_19683, partial [Mucuna pruriens]